MISAQDLESIGVPVAGAYQDSNCVGDERTCHMSAQDLFKATAVIDFIL